MLEPSNAIARLEATAETIATLCRGVPLARMRWRPTADAWSMLEVVNHLADEEREDFRTRLDLTLHHPHEPYPPIDPQGWVTARGYQQRDPAESLGRFLDERRQSLAWLRSLDNPDLQRERIHPVAGSLRAGDLLASWAAHDLLHLRQLVELHYGSLGVESAPYGVGYAGDW